LPSMYCVTYLQCPSLFFHSLLGFVQSQSQNNRTDMEQSAINDYCCEDSRHFEM